MSNLINIMLDPEMHGRPRLYEVVILLLHDGLFVSSSNRTFKMLSESLLALLQIIVDNYLTCSVITFGSLVLPA